MIKEYVDALKSAIKTNYGDLNDDSGCYGQDMYGMANWMSIKRFVELIDEVYEDYEWDDEEYYDD